MPESAAANDIHSYATPQHHRVEHVHLELTVDFDAKTLSGSATHRLAAPASSSEPLVLDTRSLTIASAEVSSDGESFAPTGHELGGTDPILGAPLQIDVPAGTSHVRVNYSTDPGATGLQWLDPPQTAGKQHPFLYSQSQAIHARSWIPIQDSPGIRHTYSATVRTPENLVAVMSAEMEDATADGIPRTGEYHFSMPQAIPPYLIAIGAGDLEFQSMGPRTGVYAEPAIVASAAAEFEDTEVMIDAVEGLYGPYLWGRYDLLVLPPSFPFGGMENPRLTFATPTILAGDKSLVSLVAHELAHSWSGNLVTNATWRDPWLNEGFTVYLENRIQEEVFGAERAAMEASLEVDGLKDELEALPEADEILYINLTGRDPDDGFTSVPYVKGMLFIRALEKAAGRETFDAFLRGYFEHFAFQSITTQQFESYLEEHLLQPNPRVAELVPVKQWIYEPGIPASADLPVSSAFAEVKKQAESWASGATAAADLPANGWVTQEWLQFLTALPEELTTEQMAELDAAFSLTQSGNSEIIAEWLQISIRNEYEAAYPRLEEFLIEVGRRKFLKPIYEELVKTDAGKERAAAIYAKARPGYQAIATGTIDGIVEYQP